MGWGVGLGRVWVGGLGVHVWRAGSSGVGSVVLYDSQRDFWPALTPSALSADHSSQWSGGCAALCNVEHHAGDDIRHNIIIVAL